MKEIIEEFVVTFEKKDYEISSFLDSHPAGRAILEEYKGKDITDAFHDVGHSDYAKKIMQKYRIISKEGDKIAEEKEKKSRPIYNLNFVYKKLFTKEDEYLVHKTFGFLALLSYMYRYLYVIPSTGGSLGFTGTFIDNVTLFVHFMLSFTSLIFHVLRTRMVEKPLIIYEEYRLHAILFTSRSIFVSAFGMYSHSLDPFLRKVILIGGILLVNILVDLVTMKFGTKGVTAVRVTNDGQLVGLKLFYSYYQIAALGSHLILSDRTCDLGFNTLVAIQSSAFLMTLRRKSIIRWYWHALWYSIALAMSYYYMYVANGPLFFVYTGFAFFLRTQLHVNKYVLWASYVFVIYYFGLQTYQLSDLPLSYLGGITKFGNFGDNL